MPYFVMKLLHHRCVLYNQFAFSSVYSDCWEQKDTLHWQEFREADCGLFYSLAVRFLLLFDFQEAFDYLDCHTYCLTWHHQQCNSAYPFDKYLVA